MKRASVVHDAVVTLRGDLDLSHQSKFERSLAGLEHCRRVLIDLSAVDFVDSTFLSQLVALKGRCVSSPSNTDIELRCKPQIARVLEAAGLARLFEVALT